MKSAVFCVTSSLLVALVISPKAEAQGMRLLTGVDPSTFIKTTGIDDFVTPTPETFSNSNSPKLCNSSQEFKSYKEIAKWVEENYQVSVKYQTLHKQIRYRMKAKLKVPRRLSNKKDPGAASELKKLEKFLKVARWLDSVDPNPAKKGLKYWCQDETRIGLKTIERKKITARGVKPIGKVQWNFKAYYLYGAVAPQTGENFWLEFSHLDSQCFQIFLDNLAA